MARPRRDDPLDEITTAYMAVGSGLSQPNVSLLSNRSLVPGFEAVSKGSYRVGDIRALKWMAAIGAFHKAGVELLLAAKLVAPIADDLEINNDGEIPSNLGRYMEKPLHIGPGDYLWEHREGDPDSRNDFWFHHHMLTRAPAKYRRGKSLLGDFVVEVADRQYVYLDVVRKPESIPVYAGIHYSADPLFKVIGWERGEDAEIRHFHHEVVDMGQFFDEPEKEREGHLHAEYLDAYAHATGRIRVNISLAIRNALDAIHDRRVRQGIITPEIEIERRDDSPVPPMEPTRAPSGAHPPTEGSSFHESP